jgi:type I restriction enzyme R subunit
MERFGEKQPDGSFRPFSLYSMRQAIEEGFILDVLKNYTTYKTYFNLIKNAAIDPTVPRTRALSAILQYVHLHDITISQKIDVIMGHFDLAVANLLDGESKAMIVTSSREAAVRYKLALDHYLRSHNYPYKTLAAFTDTIEIDGIPYTETSINDGVPETNTAREFKKPEYRFLIVAEKFQTGFDEPYLCAMYVDKRLSSGVVAVQTLSRLNRTARDKDDVFVLDFVNEVDEIRKAFQPYYTTTILSEGTDVNTLNDLRRELFAIYPIKDQALDDFVELLDPESETIHEEANSFLDEIAEQIKLLDHGVDMESDVITDNDYGKFIAIATSYIKQYPYIAQVIGYSDISHEKLYLLLKYLLKKLPKDPRKPLNDIVRYLDLSSVRVVQKVKGQIQLKVEMGDVKAVNPIPGAPTSETQDILSKIVQDVNKRWGVDFGLEQQKTLTAISNDLAKDEELQSVVTNNTRQNASVHFEGIFSEKVDDQFEGDRKLWEQLTNNPELREYIEKKMFSLVSEKIRKSRGEEKNQS